MSQPFNESFTPVPNADFLGTGWNFPIESISGKIVVASSVSDIRQSIWLILSTRKGERVMRPDFGCEINELVFAPINTGTINLAAYYVRDALAVWEPRIRVDEVSVTTDLHEDSRLNIQIDFAILSTNSDENLVYPFYLQSG